MERVHSDASLDDLLKAFFPDLAHGWEYAYRPVRVRDTGFLISITLAVFQQSGILPDSVMPLNALVTSSLL